MPLAPTQLAILDLERSHWKYAGAKATAIYERTGMSEPVYYRALNALLDNPDALAADPFTVRRLQRLRDRRRAQRRVRT